MQLAGFEVGLDRPLFLIAGPCVIEGEALAEETAGRAQGDDRRHWASPSSTSPPSTRPTAPPSAASAGRASSRGCRSWRRCARRIGVPVLTDVHEDTPLGEVAAVVDVLQTPAFLCRQTNFIRAVASQGLPVNIKKGQFLAPWDMKTVVDKARATGNDRIMVCERGVSFGYNNLVSDMRALAVMRETGCPVVFDATHSVQLPGGQGRQLRWPARVRPGAGPCRGGRRGRRALHGDPPATRSRP